MPRPHRELRHFSGRFPRRRRLPGSERKRLARCTLRPGRAEGICEKRTRTPPLERRGLGTRCGSVAGVWLAEQGVVELRVDGNRLDHDLPRLLDAFDDGLERVGNVQAVDRLVVAEEHRHLVRAAIELARFPVDLDLEKTGGVDPQVARYTASTRELEPVGILAFDL